MPRVGVTHHRALRSPDFPLPRLAPRQRPSSPPTDPNRHRIATTVCGEERGLEDVGFSQFPRGQARQRLFGSPYSKPTSGAAHLWQPVGTSHHGAVQLHRRPSSQESLPQPLLAEDIGLATPIALPPFRRMAHSTGEPGCVRREKRALSPLKPPVPFSVCNTSARGRRTTAPTRPRTAARSRPEPAASPRPRRSSMPPRCKSGPRESPP